MYIYIKGSQKKGVECNGVIAVSFGAPLPRNYLELSELLRTPPPLPRFPNKAAGIFLESLKLI